MRIVIKTKVKQSLDQVANGFDETLFVKLSPPFPKVKIEEFDGCLEGHNVALSLDFLFFTQRWHSVITYHNKDSNVFEFIDEGVELLSPLTYWKHHHQVKSVDGGSEIVDYIHFETPFPLLSFILYPLLWAQFIYRKPVYRRVFR